MNELMKFTIAIILFAITVGLIIKAMGNKPKTKKDNLEIDPQFTENEPLCTIHDNTLESVDLLIDTIKSISFPNIVHSKSHQLIIDTLSSAKQNIIDVYYLAVWESLKTIPKAQQPFLISKSTKTVYLYLAGETKHITFPETYHHYRQLSKVDAMVKRELLPKELHLATVIYILYSIHQINTPFTREELDLQASVWGVNSLELNKLSKDNLHYEPGIFNTPRTVN